MIHAQSCTDSCTGSWRNVLSGEWVYWVVNESKELWMRVISRALKLNYDSVYSFTTQYAHSTQYTHSRSFWVFWVVLLDSITTQYTHSRVMSREWVSRMSTHEWEHSRMSVLTNEYSECEELWMRVMSREWYILSRVLTHVLGREWVYWVVNDINSAMYWLVNESCCICMSHVSSDRDTHTNLTIRNASRRRVQSDVIPTYAYMYIYLWIRI